MPDLEFLERGLKGSSHGASWRPAHILLLVLSTPAACFSLHLLTPGGLVHSHLLVVDSLSLLLCFMYLLFFVLARSPTDGTTQQKIGICSLIEVFLFSVPLFHIVAVLFGTHIVSQFWETLSWSFLMSSLLVLPAAMLLGTESSSWIRVFMQSRYMYSADPDYVLIPCQLEPHSQAACRFMNVLERYACFISIATVLGTWAGAFSILLDWNRPWQVWPIPCCFGALVGNVASFFICTVMCLCPGSNVKPSLRN